MVELDKFERPKKLLEEIEFNKNFKLRIFHENLKKNWQKLSPDEQVFLLENLKKNLIEVNNKGTFTNTTLFDDIVNILIHFYNLIELKEKSMPGFTSKPFGQFKYPITLRAYIKNEGYSDDAIKKHTILVNGERCSSSDLSKLVYVDDKIVILPILHGGRK